MSQDKKITISFVVSLIVFLIISYTVQKDMREIGFAELIFGGFPLTHLVILGGGTALMKCILDKLFPQTHQGEVVDRSVDEQSIDHYMPAESNGNNQVNVIESKKHEKPKMSREVHDNPPCKVRARNVLSMNLLRYTVQGVLPDKDVLTYPSAEEMNSIMPYCRTWESLCASAVLDRILNNELTEKQERALKEDQEFCQEIENGFFMSSHVLNYLANLSVECEKNGDFSVKNYLASKRFVH